MRPQYTISDAWCTNIPVLHQIMNGSRSPSDFPSPISGVELQAAWCNMGTIALPAKVPAWLAESWKGFGTVVSGRKAGLGVSFITTCCTVVGTKAGPLIITPHGSGVLLIRPPEKNPRADLLTKNGGMISAGVRPPPGTRHTTVATIRFTWDTATLIRLERSTNLGICPQTWICILTRILTALFYS